MVSSHLESQKTQSARPRLTYTKFVDKYGKRIPRGEYHNKAAEYLAHEHGKGKQRINDSEFTMEELNLAINKQGNNKHHAQLTWELS